MIMELLKFMDEHWILGFFIICSVYYAVVLPFKLTASLLSRWMRHKNIVAQGWPPAHLDADGDWKPEPEKGDD